MSSSSLSLRSLSLFLGIALALVSIPSLAAAEGGQGLEVSPPVIELNADPGQTVTGVIRIRNITEEELDVAGKTDNFRAKGEEGVPELLLDEEEASSYSLKQWIGQLPTARLVPKEIKSIPFTIAVPQNAEPGGHYGVIRFSASAAGNPGGVALSASVGSLVLLRVSGPISEKAEIASFEVQSEGQSGSFFEHGPFKFIERVKNSGNVHLKPTGTVTIFDMRGKEVARLDVNNTSRNVLPDSVRKFDQTLNKKWLFGKYRAELALAYGENDQQIAPVSKTFWVIPYKLIAAGILLLFIIVLSFGYLIRRYNRWIISKARSR